MFHIRSRNVSTESIFIDSNAEELTEKSNTAGMGSFSVGAEDTRINKNMVTKLIYKQNSSENHYMYY